ncbi:ATP-binding protein [Desulfobacula sp.]|uniref:sensor histidine kinase n=1 Tax=Desulfobacula sp. TaxID=2593537 RepID=UPI002620DD7B|nr:ATP-binding protein [Desulfobacula sp.]
MGSIADLHDTVSQTVAWGVSSLSNIMDEKGLQQDEDFIELKETFQQALEEIRSLTFQINPLILQFMGIEGALKELSAEINYKHGVQINFSNKIKNPLTINDTLKTVLYRSVRELFMNMIKHSESKSAELSILLENESIIINYRDAGVGFSNTTIETYQRSHFGLFSINERIKILNGQFIIDSNPGAGANIKIIVPIVE